MPSGVCVCARADENTSALYESETGICAREHTRECMCGALCGDPLYKKMFSCTNKPHCAAATT